MKAFQLFAALTFTVSIAATPLRAADDTAKQSAAAQAMAKDTETPAKNAEKTTDEPDKTDDASDKTAGKAEKPQALTIASWGGAYAKAQALAFIEPFRNETGLDVTLVSHNGKFDDLKRGDMPSAPKWDVVDLGSTALDTACRAGLLKRIGIDDLARAGGEAPPADDFLPGALQDCGIASVAWSSVIAFDREAFKDGKPETAADFFNVEKFPGNRAVPNNPKYLLPLALMADGADPDDVYRMLEGEDGVERALARLETLRNDIVWWRRGEQPLELLADKKASMAVAFNGRLFYAVVRDKHPFGVIWDGQIYDMDLWAVRKGSPNRDSALKFIAFSLKPDRLAELSKWFPYGPMRKSAVARIGRHAEVDIDMRDYVPTTQAHLKRALRADAAWWAANSERLTARFEAWMTGSTDAKAPPENTGSVTGRQDAGHEASEKDAGKNPEKDVKTESVGAKKE